MKRRILYSDNGKAKIIIDDHHIATDLLFYSVIRRMELLHMFSTSKLKKQLY